MAGFSNLYYVNRKYNVEPIMFFYMVARNLYLPTAYTELIKDKICLFYYNQTREFCQNINLEENVNTHVAQSILGESVNYSLYGHIILAIPSIFASLFLGPWLDMYLTAPKIILILTIIAGFLESFIMLFNTVFFEIPTLTILMAHIPNGSVGSYMLTMTAVFTIAMKETPLTERTFRFVIIEIFQFSPSPIANYVSSYILPSKPWFFEEQTKNFFPVFILSCSFYLLALVWTIVFVGKIKEAKSDNDNLKKRASIRTSLQPMSTEYLVIQNEMLTDKAYFRKNTQNTSLEFINEAFENEDENYTQKTNDIELDANNNLGNNELKNDRPLSMNQVPKVVPIKKVTKKKMFSQIFKLRNIKSMFNTTIKKRNNGLHFQLWSLISIYVIILTCSFSISYVMVQFSAVAYNWNANKFQRTEVIGTIIAAVSSISVTYILHILNVNDSYILLVGAISTLCYNLFRGLILSPTGLYVSYITGAVYLCNLVACRAMVAKLIPSNELGSIMGALSIFYACCPILSTSLYSQLFRKTMSYNISLTFYIPSLLVLIAIAFNIYLCIKFKQSKIISN